jgi:3-methyladenine DNA glycosylase AlkC
MTSNSPPNEPDVNLSEEEKARIRAEVRYAVIAAKEARPPEKNKSVIGKVLAFFSSGIVLLIVGSFVTSLLVPSIQKQAEKREERASHLQELFEQFNLYSNTIYEEYLAIYPLAVQERLSKEDYSNYTQKIFNLKLKSANAYAKIQTLAVIVDKKVEGADNEQTSEKTEKEQCYNENDLALAIDCYRPQLEDTSNDISKLIDDFYEKSRKLKNGHFNNKNYIKEKIAKIAEDVATLLTKDREPVQKLIGQQLHQQN